MGTLSIKRGCAKAEGDYYNRELTGQAGVKGAVFGESANLD